MQYMVIRKADATSELDSFPSAELVQAVPGAKWLRPSADGGLRMRRRDGQWLYEEGPFADVSVAGFTFIEAEDRRAASELAARWPSADAEGSATVEVREAGCPGGCVGFDTGKAPQHGAWAILLRSDPVAEQDLEPPTVVIDIMNRANNAGIAAGIALSGEGLKSTARGARVQFSGGKPLITDGPFAEVKELIAGYWALDVATRDAAIAWVKSYPYPHPGDMEVELRKVAL
ncbi:YciI family protein [Pseudoduganella violaceinigra]|uniref:YciI family protein n=1 Tax=Pseudoduganella violaceinigra TaxID=246602 RepID=UPI000418CDA2|nr:YciI family protein [Pseudoduganella violaceinigra]